MATPQPWNGAPRFFGAPANIPTTPAFIKTEPGIKPEPITPVSSSAKPKSDKVQKNLSKKKRKNIKAQQKSLNKKEKNKAEKKEKMKNDKIKSKKKKKKLPTLAKLLKLLEMVTTERGLRRMARLVDQCSETDEEPPNEGNGVVTRQHDTTEAENM